MFTIAAVCRIVCSGSAGISQNRVHVVGSDRGISLSGNKHDLLVKQARPLYFSCLGTAFSAAFMQWTGEIGKLPESNVADAILTTFYFHLDCMRDILNQNMCGEVIFIVLVVICC